MLPFRNEQVLLQKPMYKETAYESSRPKYLYAFLNNRFVNLKTRLEYSIQGVIQGVKLWQTE